MFFEIRVIKLGEFFLLWDSPAEIPATYGMKDSAELEAYVTRLYGEFGQRMLPHLLSSAERDGKEFIRLGCPNAAGPNKKKLTLEQLIDAYCLRQSIIINGKKWKA